MTRLLVALGLLSILSTATLYFAGIDIVQTLSPQGCRMSWMSPSYVLQSAFDLEWSPLAKRYSLWLYREVGWESNELHGSPILFIPGNAGSSHQVRSIASSATRQYYTSPYELSHEFQSPQYKSLDFFALEFNEDLSAFHGPTLDAEKNYALAAVAFILSRYPPNTTITVLGHSMGGIVASALLPHPNISTIITMSTPHTLPPARFDRRIDAIYVENRARLANDSTPILSLCGGATDLMVPSESCILPSESVGSLYRRSVFTSALEGSWTGVGHREMVWCHQVRWRIARAALELQTASTSTERGAVLDTWLRDGHELSPAISKATDTLDLDAGPSYQVVTAGQRLDVRDPRGSRIYFMRAPTSASRFVLYASRGSIHSISPRSPLPFSASIFGCSGEAACIPLDPTVLKLVPHPIPGMPFPVPDEGADEAEGVVVFEADISSGQDVVVKVDNADGRGWVVGGFIPANTITNNAGIFATLFSTLSVAISDGSLHTQVSFPNLLSNALVVYKLMPMSVHGSCKDALFSPLLQHTSHPSETHYYPLHSSTRPILLHSHASGPYISGVVRGFTLTIFSSGESACNIGGLRLWLDWWGTLGRWGVRYGTAAASWAVGVVALVVFYAWTISETAGRTPTVRLALLQFVRCSLPMLLLLSLVISLIPLPPGLWLGNMGEPLFVLLAPLLLIIVTGLVCLTWAILTVVILPLKRIMSTLSKHREDANSRTNALLSMGFVCLLIFLLVPWQVAFLGCYVYHFYTCAGRLPRTPGASPPSSSAPASPGTMPTTDGNARLVEELSVQSQNNYLLLLMTWLLPLAAPVLAVWVRTLATAGITAPWDADHNVLCVAPFLIVVEYASVGGILLQRPSGFPAFSSKWGMLILAAVAFFAGPRSTYLVFEAASAVLGIPVLLGIVSWYRIRRSPQS